MATIKINSEGPEVLKLTKLLKQINLWPDKPTSKFNSDVRQAVKVFQSRMFDSRGRPLEPDGVVGPLTWWALETKDASKVFEDMHLESFYDMPQCTDRIGVHALRFAIGEMKKGAGEEGGNNMGPFVAKYHKMSTDKLSQVKYAWCAAFVSYCFSKAAADQNRTMPFKYTGGAQNILNQARANNKYIFKPSDTKDAASGHDVPEPGDVVVWKRGSQAWQGHVGIVHSVKDGILFVIEGNRGPYPSKVAVYDYTLSRMENLLGVIRFE